MPASTPRGARSPSAWTSTPASTVLVVANGPSPDGRYHPSAGRDTGGGFGLQGMRERIELLGGDVEAEPSGGGLDRPGGGAGMRVGGGRRPDRGPRRVW